jgi:hypothetical protein
VPPGIPAPTIRCPTTNAPCVAATFATTADPLVVSPVPRAADDAGRDDDATWIAVGAPPTFAYATYGVSATTSGSLNVSTPAASTVADTIAEPAGARSTPLPAGNADAGNNPTDVPTGNFRFCPVTVIVAI